MRKKIAILGSTGSIGTQTLDVVHQHPDLFSVEALAAGENTDLLIEQIMQVRPKVVAVASKESAERIKREIPDNIRVYYGLEGLVELTAHSDAEFVVNAVVGSLGLRPTLAAIEAGKQIGLANKETLVSAGHIVTDMIKRYNVAIIPVDSEHSAIFQCLNGEKIEHVKKITLTASGGAFRDRPKDELKHVTVEQALAHPNWSMGPKVTIDSATMANKGLEVIEAHWLFGLPYEQIDVIIHDESIIHSWVEFKDHSIMAQLGLPDMRIPIQYALSYPQRLENNVPSLNFAQVAQLNFRPMDMERYRCLKLAYDCGKAGGTAPTVYNAANEVAVSRFINGEISFLQIEEVIDEVLNRHQLIANPDLEQIEEADIWARKEAQNIN